MGSRDTWTQWFNVDNPRNGTNNGDYETLGKIENLFTVCSKGYEITSAQCRRSDSPDLVFDKDKPQIGNNEVLLRYCTKDGLICRNEDQKGLYCSDYSIRFRCHYVNENKNNDNGFPQFDVRIYIVLAVVPVLIFLARILWAYVCRRRRQRRRNQRRAQRGIARANGDYIDDDSSSLASGAANPPPSYQDLFGKTGHVGTGSSVFAISRENIPVCSKCKSEPCSVAFIIEHQRNSELLVQDPSTGSNDSVVRLATQNLDSNVLTVTTENLDSQVQTVPTENPDSQVQTVPTENPDSHERTVPTENPESQVQTMANEDTNSTTQTVATVSTEQSLGRENPNFIIEDISESNIQTVNTDSSQQCVVHVNAQEKLNQTMQYSELAKAEETSSIGAQDSSSMATVSLAAPNFEESLLNEDTQPSIGNNFSDSVAHGGSLGDRSNLNLNNLHNENYSENLPENTSLEEFASKADVAQSETVVILAPSLLVPRDISQPCACPCHRTIPLKHEGAAGYDNQGFAVEGDDVEAGVRTSFPGMHIPALGIQRAWSQLSIVTQSELPTYELALELMNKKKKKETEMGYNSS